MKNIIKFLKYLGAIVLLLGLCITGYMYSLTFTPFGRMDWGQALFNKLMNAQAPVEALKKMNLEQRRQVFSKIPYPDFANIDSLKITMGELAGTFLGLKI